MKHAKILSDLDRSERDLHVINAAFGMTEALELDWDDKKIQSAALDAAGRFFDTIRPLK
jgi:hypothetical protein